MRLSEAREGQILRLVSLPADGPLCSRLLAMGIRPGAILQVLRRGRPGGLLHLSSGVLEFMVRKELAALMAVSQLDGSALT